MVKVNMSAEPGRQFNPLDYSDPMVGRILDAAEQCIHRFGIRRTSMGEVARVGKLSRGSIYRHFGDKESLVEGVFKRRQEMFLNRTEAALEKEPTLVDKLTRSVVTGRRDMEEGIFASLAETEPETVAIRGVPLVAGRNVNRNDLRLRRRVVVLGDRLRKNLLGPHGGLAPVAGRPARRADRGGGPRRGIDPHPSGWGLALRARPEHRAGEQPSSKRPGCGLPFVGAVPERPVAYASVGRRPSGIDQTLRSQCNGHDK